MAKSINTIEGREALARIVRQARGKRGLRGFAKDAGVSHGTISKLENALTKNPEDATLLAIAPATGLSLEELKAVLASRTTLEIRRYRTAQEAWAVVHQLPRKEKALLGQMILAELGELSVD